MRQRHCSYTVFVNVHYTNRHPHHWPAVVEYFGSHRVFSSGRQHQSVVRQSAEVDRSALSSEQFRSSVFCCCRPEVAYLTVSRPSTESQQCLGNRHQLKTYFLAKY